MDAGFVTDWLNPAPQQAHALLGMRGSGAFQDMNVAAFAGENRTEIAVTYAPHLTSPLAGERKAD
jgi:hypothetical protein